MEQNKLGVNIAEYCNKAIRANKGNIYYFDETGLLTKISAADALSDKKISGIELDYVVHQHWQRFIKHKYQDIDDIDEQNKLINAQNKKDIEEFITDWEKSDTSRYYNLFTVRTILKELRQEFILRHPNLEGAVFTECYDKVRKAIKEGSTFDKFIEQLSEEVQKDAMYNFIFGTKLSFERECGNNNKNTFDFIRVKMTTPAYCKNSIQIIKENKDRILKIAVQKIKDSRQFKSYEIPINCIRVTNMVLTHTKELEILFEIKVPETKADTNNV